jgi:outer membrane protein assembly factor BamA
MLAAPGALAAQDITCQPGDTEVRSLSFDGNETFRDFVLADGIVTEATSWVRRWFRVFGSRRCWNELEFARDALRIAHFYRERGYGRVQVDTAIALRGDNVSLRFIIDEGVPTRVERVEVIGLDSVPERALVEDDLPLRAGDPFDRVDLVATIDTIRRRLRDNGYPAADVFQTSTIAADSLTASVLLEVLPGTRARIRGFQIEIDPRANQDQQISEDVVRDIIGARPGELYRERKLERALYNLALLGAYERTRVEVDSADVAPPGDSLITVHVRLREGYMQSASAAPGWGTLDCFRVQGDYVNNNFMHQARKFEARARLSKIGIGRPLSGASALCYAPLRDDPYSTRLNYYGGMTLTARTILPFGMRPSGTVYSERRGEYLAFLRSVPVGALVTATREAELARRTQKLSYQIEYGRTDAQPAILCALFNLCIPEDRSTALEYRRLGLASWSLRQDWTDSLQFPTSGSVVNVELRHASSAVGSDRSLQFSRATGDVTFYFGLTPTRVLAARFRAGAVVGPSFSGTSRFIPPQERLFAGGASTLRGVGDNELGPRVYIAAGYDTVRADGTAGPVAPGDTVFFRTRTGATAQRSVPTGGAALLLGNLELRMPAPFLSDRVQMNLFTDIGELWSPGSDEPLNGFRSLKVTPGIGFRFATPVGRLGFDVAYNAYAPREGSVFYDSPIELGGQLFCVSPGNSLPVTLGASGAAAVQAPGSCPATFAPPRSSGFFKRLQFHFAIGQAF